MCVGVTVRVKRRKKSYFSASPARFQVKSTPQPGQSSTSTPRWPSPSHSRLPGPGPACPSQAYTGCPRRAHRHGRRGRPASGTGNLKQCGIVTPTGRVYSAGPGRWSGLLRPAGSTPPGRGGPAASLTQAGSQASKSGSPTRIGRRRGPVRPGPVTKPP